MLGPEWVPWAHIGPLMQFGPEFAVVRAMPRSNLESFAAWLQSNRPVLRAEIPSVQSRQIIHVVHEGHTYCVDVHQSGPIVYFRSFLRTRKGRFTQSLYLACPRQTDTINIHSVVSLVQASHTTGVRIRLFSVLGAPHSTMWNIPFQAIYDNIHARPQWQQERMMVGTFATDQILSAGGLARCAESNHRGQSVTTMFWTSHHDLGYPLFRLDIGGEFQQIRDWRAVVRAFLATVMPETRPGSAHECGEWFMNELPHQDGLWSLGTRHITSQLWITSSRQFCDTFENVHDYSLLSSRGVIRDELDTFTRALVAKGPTRLSMLYYYGHLVTRCYPDILVTEPEVRGARDTPEIQKRLTEVIDMMDIPQERLHRVDSWFSVVDYGILWLCACIRKK